MYILAFDTSSKTVSVAVLKNNDIIYEKTLDTGLNHSETILPAIDRALRDSNLQINEIDLFACTLGPGSFTGVRIAVSTIKGMMLATLKPAVGVSALAAIALNVPYTKKMICAVMDAGRGQVYTATFCYDKESLLLQLTPEINIHPQNIHTDVNNDVICAGEGALRYAELILKNNKNVFIDKNITPCVKASSVGILGMEKYQRGELLNPDNCVPVYLRKSDALPKVSLFAQ
ncbi:MAG: tRNA (adenosine(37)-N6)-threonylcarbamoyltransferase complex dimerization subunit type 1 TsaB [Syntrophaceae bacterium]|nr:tRNA (adenosine(37)-N6)-threonylcarbamoyltransferase complex dimerization subunit type 1 TsaB [Syntrophaceae bacterium]